MVVKVKNLNFTYKDGLKALSDISFEIKEKSLVVILGESGSGKTSLVKNIAGLLNPDSGRVYINGEDVTDFITASRDLTMVFQNFVLYPHMTIYENVLTALNGFDLSWEDKDIKVKNILEKFGLRNYLNFKPRHLSEGQKQRVAIARALIRKPLLFILDEPLSNLDAPQKKKIRKELKRIYESGSSTFLYVTHDVDDAEYLSTHVLLLDKGHLLQTGTINDIKNHPISLKAARLIYGGEINEIDNGDYPKLVKQIAPNTKTIVIPYRHIKPSENGKIKTTFRSAKIVPKGILLSLVSEEGLELYSLISDDEIIYKENDIVYVDVVDKFFRF